MSENTFTNYVINDVFLEIPHTILNDRLKKTFSSGKYEETESKILSKVISNDEIVLELGAGVGFISSIAGKNPLTKSIYAIEADPRLIPVIKRTHALNGVTATVYNEMLGPCDGKSEFHIAYSFIASSANGAWGGEKIEINMSSFQRRLDEIKPTLLIMDIEGGEAEIFKGVELNTVNKIMMELHPEVIGLEGIKVVFDTLSGQNFTYDTKNSWGNVVTFRKLEEK